MTLLVIVTVSRRIRSAHWNRNRKSTIKISIYTEFWATCSGVPKLLKLFSCNQNVQYRVDNSVLAVHTLSQISSVHTLQLCFSKNYFVITHPTMFGLPSGLFSCGFPTEILYSFLISSIRAICPARLILLELIILMIFREKYRLWSPSLGNIKLDIKPPSKCTLRNGI
jgi:hypothetical protein